MIEIWIVIASSSQKHIYLAIHLYSKLLEAYDPIASVTSVMYNIPTGGYCLACEINDIVM